MAPRRLPLSIWPLAGGVLLVSSLSGIAFAAGAATPRHHSRQASCADAGARKLPAARGRRGWACLIVIRPVRVGVTRGRVLTKPAFETIAPWQAEIYSTYRYTAADEAADKKLPATSVDKRYLELKAPWERAHRCGGVYLGQGWVLTAAHCVTTASTGDDYLTLREVRLGAWDLSTARTGYKIVAAAVHKDYLANPNTNDIALLKVDLPAPDAALGLAPAHLLDPASTLSVGDEVAVTGWGATRPKQDGPMMRSTTGIFERASARLREAKLRVMPAAACEAVRAYAGTLTSETICAGSGAAGRDACTWDSGGPLVRVADGALVGIVSRGYGCGLKDVPGIYTRVGSYRGWIEKAKQAPLGHLSFL